MGRLASPYPFLLIVALLTAAFMAAVVVPWRSQEDARVAASHIRYIAYNMRNLVLGDGYRGRRAGQDTSMLIVAGVFPSDLIEDNRLRPLLGSSVRTGFNGQDAVIALTGLDGPACAAMLARLAQMSDRDREEIYTGFSLEAIRQGQPASLTGFADMRADSTDLPAPDACATDNRLSFFVRLFDGRVIPN